MTNLNSPVVPEVIPSTEKLLTYQQAREILIHKASSRLDRSVAFPNMSESARDRVCRLADSASVLLTGILMLRSELIGAEMMSDELMELIIIATQKALECRMIELRMGVQEDDKLEYNVGAGLVASFLELNCAARFETEEQAICLAEAFVNSSETHAESQEI